MSEDDRNFLAQNIFSGNAFPQIKVLLFSRLTQCIRDFGYAFS